uniref:Uncharacterized protein n=1 Tax=Arundo donax TaxID=35708 RepID=A0A0A9BM93_ARUDO
MTDPLLLSNKEQMRLQFFWLNH